MPASNARPLLLRWCPPRLSAAWAMLLGGVGLAGWLLNIPGLQVIVPGLPAMSVNTALSLLLAATALLAIADPTPQPGRLARNTIAASALGLAGLVALLSLLEYAVGNGWSVLRAPLRLLSAQSTQLISSPHTALSTLLITIALGLLARPRSHARAVAGHLAVLGAIAVLLVVATGYLFSVPFFYRISPDTGMALHTWLGLMFLAMGTVTLRPTSGLAALWFSDALGSRMLRSLLPMGALLVFLFYLLGVWGERLIQTRAHAVSFVAILWIALLALGRLARHLNREETMRLEAQAQYQGLFEGIPDAIVVADTNGRIVQVNEQTEQLTGYPRSELVGQTVEKLVPHDLRVTHVQHRERFEDNPYARPIGADLNLTLLQRGGARCPVSIAIRPTRIGDRQLNILSVRDLSERKRLEQDLAELSHVAGHDSLTGLPNRRLLDELLVQALAAARRHGKRVAVCYCDLDGFKAVNDGIGHRAGDALLLKAAHRMLAALREQDTVARVGGDEFVIALSDLDHRDDANAVADKLVASLAEPYTIDDRTVTVTASVGISLFPDHADTPEQLIRKADEVLLRVKQSGKNQSRVYGG